MFLTAPRHSIHGISHDSDERRWWQSVESILDGSAVVPFAFRQFGFDLIERTDFREAGDGAILIDIPKNLFGIKFIHEVGNLLNELSQVFRIVFAVNGFERSGHKIQVSERR